MPPSEGRPDWDEYFIGIADTVATRATCDRGKSGCVITKDNQIIAAGYVGSPPGMEHCDDVGHLLKKVTHEDGSESEHCMRTVHAEQNAIYQAAKKGQSLEHATLYCRMTPCRNCAMAIVSVGIDRVVAEKKYQRAEETEKIFKLAKVALEHIYEEVMEYSREK